MGGWVAAQCTASPPPLTLGSAPAADAGTGPRKMCPGRWATRGFGSLWRAVECHRNQRTDAHRSIMIRLSLPATPQPSHGLRSPPATRSRLQGSRGQRTGKGVDSGRATRQRLRRARRRQHQGSTRQRLLTRVEQRTRRRHCGVASVAGSVVKPRGRQGQLPRLRLGESPCNQAEPQGQDSADARRERHGRRERERERRCG